MDDDALHARLRGIERRQYLLLALLVPPNFLAAAEFVGYYVAGVGLAALVLLGFAFVLVSNRRRRNAAGA